ncbi:MAG: GTP cyclohydrolase II [Ardenticatenaceae bacterium]|nr:GTP cyclohydrolase II [Ardenticatenaceae bacterium]MCB9443227.1 GTP cyclohydrolase II [Ardenticatenaceae bacterium]
MKQAKMEPLTCARIPTDTGEFKLCLFNNSPDGKEHLALVMGDVTGQDNVLVRVHSECFTGDVLGSRRCDCGEQLNRAMQLIALEGRGIILYLRQEGRGIGLLSKLRAYNLQDEGYDTVEANLMLGHQADERDYTAAALMLQSLGVRSLRLITNNPTKIESLQALAVNVVDRVPLQPQITADNANYLVTKVQRMRHLLELNGWANGNGHHVQDLTSKNNVHRQRPFITLSYAQSMDGSITARRGQPLALSGPESMAMTHQLRANHDAILVGIGTVLADDPSLTVRLVNGRNPQPVILDSQLRFPLNARLLKNSRRPWIATTVPVNSARRKQLEATGAQVLAIAPNSQGQVDLNQLMTELHQRGIKRLMVEGGASVITSFLATRLVDRIVLTIAPVLVGGLSAVGGFAQSGSVLFPRLSNPRYEQFGEDLVLSGDVLWAEDKAEIRRQKAEVG